MPRARSTDYLKLAFPTEELLLKRLIHSLNFARDTLRHLIVDGHPESEDAPWFVRNEKIIGECAFLLVFSKANSRYPEVEEAFSALIEVLEPLARSESVLLNICLKPGLALDYAQAHVCLNYAGVSNAKFDKVLRAALDSSAADGIERPPNRMMEREWLKKIWDNDRKTNMDLWRGLSCLNYPVDIFSQNSNDAYSITHAVMYGLFGRETIEDINLGMLFEIIESLLIRYLDEQNYDVVGELLMTWPLLKRRWNNTAVFALQCLFHIDERVGFLPAPGLDRSKIEGAERDVRRTYIYSINYHTVLVMGLLCNTLLENIDKESAIFFDVNWMEVSRNEIDNEIAYGKEVHWNPNSAILGSLY